MMNLLRRLKSHKQKKTPKLKRKLKRPQLNHLLMALQLRRQLLCPKDYQVTLI